MPKLYVTDPARADLDDIRAYTLENYGRAAADDYDTLLKQAILDVLEDPFRLGSRDRPEIITSFRTYHISTSRRRAGTRVKSPRHFLLYFLSDADELVVSRVLHDASDLARHIPESHLRYGFLAHPDEEKD